MGRDGLGPDFSSVKADRFIYNGKPQAGSAQFAAASFVCPVKTLVKMRKAFLRNTRSVIGDGKLPLAVLLLCFDAQMAAFPSSFFH